MISLKLVALVSLVYFGILFGVAYYADRQRKRGRSLIDNPSVYSLSLAVYCTSWTFYGSVGRAATTGIDFLTIYLGPTLIAFTWWFLLRKIVRISKEQNAYQHSRLHFQPLWQIISAWSNCHGLCGPRHHALHCPAAESGRPQF